MRAEEAEARARQAEAVTERWRESHEANTDAAEVAPIAAAAECKEDDIPCVDDAIEAAGGAENATEEPPIEKEKALKVKKSEQWWVAEDLSIDDAVTVIAERLSEAEASFEKAKAEKVSREEKYAAAVQSAEDAKERAQAADQRAADAMTAVEEMMERVLEARVARSEAESAVAELDEKRAKLVKDEGLEEEETWVDTENLDADLNNEMSSGIDRAKLVIVFITKAYIEKVQGFGRRGLDEACKAEFEYALRRHGAKRMLAVVMDPECRDTSTWTGAVGFRLGSQIYHDLSGDAAEEERVGALVAAIGSRIQLPLGYEDRRSEPNASPELEAAALRDACLRLVRTPPLCNFIIGASEPYPEDLIRL